jgi:hypothetical protein
MPLPGAVAAARFFEGTVIGCLSQDQTSVVVRGDLAVAGFGSEPGLIEATIGNLPLTATVLDVALAAAKAHVTRLHVVRRPITLAAVVAQGGGSWLVNNTMSFARIEIAGATFVGPKPSGAWVLDRTRDVLASQDAACLAVAGALAETAKLEPSADHPMRMAVTATGSVRVLSPDEVASYRDRWEQALRHLDAAVLMPSEMPTFG